VGTERDERLAGKVVFFQEREESHRQRVPPVRIADENRVVVRHVPDFGGQPGAKTGFLLTLCLIGRRTVFLRICVYRPKLENISAGTRLDLIGHMASVARPREIGGQDSPGRIFGGEYAGSARENRGKHASRNETGCGSREQLSPNRIRRFFGAGGRNVTGKRRFSFYDVFLESLAWLSERASGQDASTVSGPWSP
jgi:hypothetical protein